MAILIAIEGIDGAGKTTQAALLAAVLGDAGISTIKSKEPTNGPYGQKIRQSASSGRLQPADELEVFLADRREHVETLIQPSLDTGKVVIIDRYYYSTIAYQGSRGADIERIRESNAGFPVPDIVFLLEVPPSLGIERVSKRGDTPNAFENFETLCRVQAVFDRLGDDNIIRIDGRRAIRDVHSELLAHTINGPLRRKLCAKKYGCDDPFHCSPRFSGQCEWWNIKNTIGESTLVAS